MVDVPPLRANSEDAGVGGADAAVADALPEDGGWDRDAEQGGDVAENEADAEEARDAEDDDGWEAEAEAPDCPMGTGECDGDLSNGCEDLTSDERHCGRCGHDCGGGACEGGVCRPVLLAVAPANAYAIVVDEQYVYGTSATATGQVWKVPRDGCPDAGACAVTVSHVVGDYRDLAMDQQALYVTAVIESEGRVIRIRKDGTEECMIVGGQVSPAGVAVDDLYVYWTDTGGDAVRRAPKGCGSTPEHLVSTPDPFMLRIDPTGLYWTSSSGGLVSWATADGQSTALVWSGASTGNFMFGLALDNEWVYWREGYQMDWNGPGRVLRVRKDRTGGEQVFGGDERQPRYLAVDDSHVYWTVKNGLHRASYSSPAAVEPLASGDNYKSAHGVALDEQSVYFCEYSSGELYRVAK